MAGGGEALARNHVGYAHLRVAVLPDMQIEHVADQFPLQARAAAREHRKPGTRYPRPARKVEEPKPFPQLPVWLRLEREVPLRSPLADQRVGILATIRHFGERQVGHLQKGVPDVPLDILHHFAQGVDPAAYPAHFHDQLVR